MLHLNKVYEEYEKDMNEGKPIDDAFLAKNRLSIYGVIIFGILSLVGLFMEFF